ncbi:MAG TPA: DUF5947 family protein [Tepidisphaeraceae bacterium]|jgi:hypothetical protein|nr:DUF5947 family protein [Tepidisphaeraceae bacterium]
MTIDDPGNPPGSPTAPRNPIGVLQRFARPRAPVERCDLCAAELPPDHQHLLEPANRKISCACDPCAILFSGRADLRYKRVPRRIEAWPDFVMSELQWQSLGVPIALAFFFHSSPQQQIVAVYPSPGGATESTIPGEAWDFVTQENPGLAKLEPDVEALLANRIRGARSYYRVPIDECFKLVGLVRTNWRGLSGGAAMWQEVDKFFAHLESRATKRVHAPSPGTPGEGGGGGSFV